MGFCEALDPKDDPEDRDRTEATEDLRIFNTGRSTGGAVEDRIDRAITVMPSELLVLSELMVVYMFTNYGFIFALYKQVLIGLKWFLNFLL